MNPETERTEPREGRPRKATHRLCRPFDPYTTAYVLAVLLHLAPLWVFPYLPTQDGPAHLHTAIILKDLHAPNTRYHELFEANWGPLPNLSCQVLLIGLMHVFPPLVSERIVASLYVLGFACSFRYFLGSFGRPAVLLAPIGLLFLFNSCFLMGFYNYCLSVVLVWLILGFVFRRRDRIGPSEVGLLLLLFTITYATHLAGYVIAAGGALCIVAGTGRQRLRHLLGVCGAALPAGCLAIWHLDRHGFFEQLPPWSVSQSIHAALSVHALLFGPYERPYVPLGLLIVLLYEVVVLAHLLSGKDENERPGTSRNRRRIWILVLGVTVLYLLVPDFLGRHGGFLKMRLAIFPPLMILAGLPVNPRGLWRIGLVAAVYVLIGLNLYSVTCYFVDGNREIREFVAGAGRVGRNRTLAVYGASRYPWPNALEHAESYYCLGTGNIAVVNYQARSANFPIRYRAGVSLPGPGPPWEHREGLRVDVILLWGVGQVPPGRSSPYREIYRRGRLRIFGDRQSYEPRS